MTNKEKNELVKLYEPLICMITKQFFNKTVAEWYNIKSMAYEGFALAIKRYDPKRSNMTFTQYAAFMIRNSILSGLDHELRTVRLSNYALKTAETTFNSVSIDEVMDIDNKYNPNVLSNKTKDILNSLVEGPKVFENDDRKRLYEILESHFDKKYCTMFYLFYGLNGYKETRNMDIAKMYDCTPMSVSLNTRKIIKFIREHKELHKLLK